MVSCIYGVIRIGISAAARYGTKIIQRIVILISMCNAYVIRSGCIFAFHWIVATVGEHVVAQQALSGGGVCVRINKSTDGRSIKSGLQIIEPGLGIEIVSAVAEGIDIGQVAGLSQDVAPGVINVETAALFLPISPSSPY